jgi:hypothetical protein
VNKYEKMKLMKVLPKPEELEGCMPQMNQPRMLIELLTDNKQKIANITLIALLIGTTKALMKETPDWDEYLKPNANDTDDIEGEDAKPCGDPECEGCVELQKAIDEAPPGTKIKMMRLTREQAKEIGIDVDAVEKAHDENQTSEGEVVH